MWDEKIKENKKLIIVILVGVIIILGFILVFFKDTIFVQTIKLTFPDGCVEIYKNGVAVTPLCTNGRMLEKQKINPMYNTNISGVIR